MEYQWAGVIEGQVYKIGLWDWVTLVCKSRP